MGTATFGMKTRKERLINPQTAYLGQKPEWGHHGINICLVKRQDRDRGKRMGETVSERDISLSQG